MTDESEPGCHALLHLSCLEEELTVHFETKTLTQIIPTHRVRLAFESGVKKPVEDRHGRATVID